MIFHFLSVQVHFFKIEFHCTFSISDKILPYYVYYYCILLFCGRQLELTFSVPSFLLSLLMPLFSSSVYLISFLLFPCASDVKTLASELPISYIHREWYLLFH